MTAGGAYAPGFSDPPVQSQAVFRAVLAAMAQPGSVHPCGLRSDAPLPAAMAAVALTLMDYETPFWLEGFPNAADVSAYLQFHTGAMAAPSRAEAAFVLVHAGALVDLAAFNAGDPAYPDRSATMVLDTGPFGGGDAVELSGPGLKQPVRFSASCLDRAFWRQAAANAALYPLGLDFIFCGEAEVAALPRSTRIRIIGD